MSSYQKVICMGRVGRDPDIKSLPSGQKVANLSIAVDESFTNQAGEKVEKTEWIRIVAWRKLADIIEQYVRKGSLCLFEGKMETRSWEKDGQKHYQTEVNAFNMQMVGPRPQENNQAPAPSNQDNGLGF